MARPKFPEPACILPASCIRSIVEDQNYYDEDPVRYERQEQEREERRREEEQQLNEEYLRRRNET